MNNNEKFRGEEPEIKEARIPNDELEAVSGGAEMPNLKIDKHLETNNINGAKKFG